MAIAECTRPPASVAATRSRGRSAWAPALVVATGAVVYWSSLSAPFFFDDHRWIVENPGVRSLAGLVGILSETNRPVVMASLALNYALGGVEPFGYHAFNLVVHLLAALLVFGIVRRTLSLERYRERYGRRASQLACAAALLWVAHPLQTQAVTYVIQRAESLTGLFYLLTLYCVIRAHEGRRAAAWSAGAVAACAGGMGTKAVMVTAPIVVLLYDRTFLAESFAGALERRRGLYPALAATWLVLLGALRNPAVDAGTTLVSPLEYARTQPEILLHYLKLSIWPSPQCFDYAWPVARSPARIAAAGLAVFALLAATGWALWRRSGAGFAGAWFFLVLAPTSTVLPIQDLANEHRMYLPLAALATLAAILGFEVLAAAGRHAGALRVAALAAAVAALGTASVSRNHVYRSELSLWQDTVRVAPHNARAFYNLGVSEAEHGNTETAMQHYRRALDRNPNYRDALQNLGSSLQLQGRWEDSIPLHRRAVALDPDFADAHFALGVALVQTGRSQEAVGAFLAAIRVRPEWPEALNNAAWILATHEDPRVRNASLAIRLAEGAVAHTGERNPWYLDTLATAQAAANRFDRAVETERRALALAAEAGDPAMLEAMHERLALFSRGEAWREPTPETRAVDRTARSPE